MHPIYTHDQLVTKSLTELKQIAEAIACTKVADKRSKQSWVNAILDHQTDKVEKVKTCATCPLFRPFNDGTGRGLCCGSDTVSRDYHPQTGDCGHMIEDAASNPTANLPEGQIVQSGSLFFKPTERVGNYEVWVGTEKYGIIKMLEDGMWLQSYSMVTKYSTPYQAAAALIEAAKLRQSRSSDVEVLEHWDDKFVVYNKQNGHHYVVQPNHPERKERCECGDCYHRGAICKHQIAVADRIKIESLLEHIEIDSASDPDFGVIYRVWKSWELLGTFYHGLDGYWIAQPCGSEERPRSLTATQAQISILTIAGRLVISEDDLLDKPFDELTFAEWQKCKRSEMAIA